LLPHFIERGEVSVPAHAGTETFLADLLWLVCQFVSAVLLENRKVD
jgi:hypothetical protein